MHEKACLCTTNGDTRALGTVIHVHQKMKSSKRKLRFSISNNNQEKRIMPTTRSGGTCLTVETSLGKINALIKNGYKEIIQCAPENEINKKKTAIFEIE